MRVDQIVERFGDAVAVEWRSFLLRPEQRERDLDDFRRYTESWARPAAAEPSITFTQWASASPAPTGSLPAQVAAKAVEQVDPDRLTAFHRALMVAYFTDNRTISDWDVLAEVAVECGIDPRAVVDLVAAEQEQLAAAVIADHNAAVEVGITAVPTMVLDDVLPVQGAQDFASYEHWITRLLDRRTSNPA